MPYLVPTTVDGGLDSPNPPHLLRSPLWNNLVLLLGFGLQHRCILCVFVVDILSTLYCGSEGGPWVFNSSDE